MAARVGTCRICGEVPESSRMYLDFFVDLLLCNGYASRALKKGLPLVEEQDHSRELFPNCKILQVDVPFLYMSQRAITIFLYHSHGV